MRPPAWPLSSTDETAAARLLDGIDVTGSGLGRSQLYGFHYLGWLLPGVQAWKLTDDLRYLQAFEQHLDDWVSQRDSVVGEWPGLDPIWYSLGTWARCRSLLPTLEVLTDSPLSDRVWGRLVATLVGGARWAYDEHDVFRHGNWQLVCATELLHISAVLPSLVESGDWASRARERISEHLLLDVYPDGGHYERSPGYHRMVLTALQTAARIDPAVAAHPRFAAMHRWMRELVSSGGWMPHLQDSGIEWPAESFERGGFPVAGELPPSTVLPESGYTILRGADVRAVINHGPHIEHELESHSHRAVLDLVMDGWQQPLLWEAGGPPSYDDPSYLTWYQSGVGHNTVVVGDQELSTDRHVEVDPLVDTGPVAVFSGRHRGYGVSQSRKIVMVREEPAYFVVLDETEATQCRTYWHALHPWQELRPGVYNTANMLLLTTTSGEQTVGTARRPVLETRSADYGPLHSLALPGGDLTTVLVPHAQPEPPDVTVEHADELLVRFGATVDRLSASTCTRTIGGRLSWATGWRVRELPGLLRAGHDINVLAKLTEHHLQFEVNSSGRCGLWIRSRGRLRLNGIPLDVEVEGEWAHLTLPYAGPWTVDAEAGRDG
ncbi:heparinase II/III family protein [Kribbella sp. GL6]|uniref:heparinase II/III family protein n=1 Tax=Kribbella sp. GL6 TaxID=3419765 RepID=UPI003CFF754E